MCDSDFVLEKIYFLVKFYEYVSDKFYEYVSDNFLTLRQATTRQYDNATTFKSLWDKLKFEQCLLLGVKMEFRRSIYGFDDKRQFLNLKRCQIVATDAARAQLRCSGLIYLYAQDAAGF